MESEKRAIEELTHFYGRGSDLRVGVNSLYIRVKSVCHSYPVCCACLP